MATMAERGRVTSGAATILIEGRARDVCPKLLINFRTGASEQAADLPETQGRPRTTYTYMTARRLPACPPAYA